MKILLIWSFIGGIIQGLMAAFRRTPTWRWLVVR